MVVMHVKNCCGEKLGLELVALVSVMICRL